MKKILLLTTCLLNILGGVDLSNLPTDQSPTYLGSGVHHQETAIGPKISTAATGPHASTAVESVKTEATEEASKYSDLENARAAFAKIPDFADWYVETHPESYKIWNTSKDSYHQAIIFVRLLDSTKTKERLGYWAYGGIFNSAICFQQEFIPDSIRFETRLLTSSDSILVSIAGLRLNEEDYSLTVLKSSLMDNKSNKVIYEKNLNQKVLYVDLLSEEDLLYVTHDHTQRFTANIDNIKNSSVFKLEGLSEELCLLVPGKFYRWKIVNNRKSRRHVLKKKGLIYRKRQMFPDMLLSLEHFNPRTKKFESTNFGPFLVGEINNMDPNKNDILINPNNPRQILGYRDLYFGDSRWKFLSEELAKKVEKAKSLMAKFLGGPFNSRCYSIECISLDAAQNYMDLDIRFAFGSADMVRINFNTNSLVFNGQQIKEKSTDSIKNEVSLLKTVPDLIQSVKFAKAKDGYKVPYIVFARKAFYSDLNDLYNVPTMYWVEGGPSTSFIKAQDHGSIVTVLNLGGIVVVPRERGRMDCGIMHVIERNLPKTIDDGKTIIRDIHKNRIVGHKLLINGCSYGGTFGAEIMFAQDLPRDLEFTVISAAPHLGGNTSVDGNVPYRLDQSFTNPTLKHALFTHGVYDVRCPIGPVRALAKLHKFSFISHEAGHDSLVDSDAGQGLLQALWDLHNDGKSIPAKVLNTIKECGKAGIELWNLPTEVVKL